MLLLFQEGEGGDSDQFADRCWNNQIQDGVSCFWESIMGGAVPLIRRTIERGKSTPAVDVLKQCTEVRYQSVCGLNIGTRPPHSSICPPTLLSIKAVIFDERLNSADPYLLFTHLNILSGLILCLDFLVRTCRRSGLRLCRGL